MKRITIIGGGLAGLTLGIALRREGVPVTVWEAGDYPRHRVCGEFISGRGLQTLQRLDLIDKRARTARTIAFYVRGRKILSRRLPREALCLSRYRLDAFLAQNFFGEGGELRIRSRWTKATDGEGLVRANGRRVRPQVEGARWYGLKAHATKVALAADLEMHFDADRYVGLCQLSDNCVNVCGLLRDVPHSTLALTLALSQREWESYSPLPEGEGQGEGECGVAVHGERESRFDKLRGRQGTELNSRLSEAKWNEDSFCAIAGLPPYPRLATDGACVGDALSMPAPLTGNGMSMAFESAEIAAHSLIAYARGALDWQSAIEHMRSEFERAFQARLRWSSFLHRVLFRPRLEILGLFASLYWRGLFHATR